MLTFSELQQAASGLTDGDLLLQILSRPAFWALALLSVVLLVGSRFVKVSPKYQNALAGVVLAFTAITATLVMSVPGTWVAAQGDLAQKSARYLGWQRTDAATFSRFEVLRLKHDLAHDVGVGQTVLEGLVKKGSTEKEAEPLVMLALAYLHRKDDQEPGKATAVDASAAPAALGTAASADLVIPPAAK